MLFLSPHPQYQLVGIRQPVPQYHPANGVLLDTVPGIDAEFFHGGAPSWAIEQALANEQFQKMWSGLPPEQEKRAMVSTFDTDEYAKARGLSDEDKQFLEERMLAHPDYGTRYILAVSPAESMSPPWPTYEGTHHFRVVKIALEIGADLQYVLEYEQTRKKPRRAVIEAVEAELAKNAPALVEPLIAA